MKTNTIRGTGETYVRRYGRLVTNLAELYFDSYSDLEENVNLRKPNTTWHRPTESLGCRSYSELVEKVKTGWPELARKMTQMMAEIELPIALTKPEISKRRKRRRGNFGDSLDIHEVNQGRVDRAWERPETVEHTRHSNKLVHVAINVCPGSASIPFTDSLWRGAAAMRIYEALLKMRRSVAVTVFYPAAQMFRGVHGMISLQVKGYGDPLTPERLAAFINNGFSRYHFLSCASGAHPKYGLSYGQISIDTYDVVPSSVTEDVRGGGECVYVGACFSRRTAELVLENFKSQMLREEGSKLAAWRY